MRNRDDTQTDVMTGCSPPRKSRLSPWRRSAFYLIGSVVLLLNSMTVPALPAAAVAAVPPGVWLMDAKVAIQIWDCDGLLCGRVIWLKAPLDAQGLLKRDIKNPDPALRERQVCGPTIIWNARPSGSNRWEDGWFYNPDDGKTYRTSMELKSDDVIAARIYSVLKIFGENKTLIRVPRGTSEGWC